MYSQKRPKVQYVWVPAPPPRPNLHTLQHFCWTPKPQVQTHEWVPAPFFGVFPHINAPQGRHLPPPKYIILNWGTPGASPPCFHHFLRIGLPPL